MNDRGSAGASGLLDKTSLHDSLSDPALDGVMFLNDVADRYPHAISFATGQPYEEFFELGQIGRAINAYIEHLRESDMTDSDIRRTLFQYGPTRGLICEMVARTLARDEGLSVSPDSIVITSGCQEAVLVTLRTLFARPEDVLIVPDPCYPGVRGAAGLLGIPIRAVTEGEDGMDAKDVQVVVDDIRAAGMRPRAVYVIPEFSNPTGVTMSLERRLSLLELARREHMLILEDSPYRLLSVAERLPMLKKLDLHQTVIYLGSFAKTLLPGARVGFVFADQMVTDSEGRRGALAHAIAKVKSMVTLNTSTVGQAVVGGLLVEHDFAIADATRRAAEHYSASMRSVLNALDRELPPSERRSMGVRWNEPAGGFFVTLRVPFEADLTALERSASQFGVIWTPMLLFSFTGDAYAIRLSCSNLVGNEIDEGVSRVAAFLRTTCGPNLPAASRLRTVT